ncbi:MAG: hypothetical protein ACLP0J_25265 [Solirubrobacteraceae bacterium]
MSEVKIRIAENVPYLAQRVAVLLPCTAEGVEAAINVASLAELHYGVLIADDDERAARTQ